MAYGAETAGASALAHTIYIRLSRDLIDRSWQWPDAWHRAFEQASAELALAAATCVLEGDPVTTSLIEVQLDGACLELQIESKGTSITITFLAFTGPETGPDGPNGGCQQPRAAEGLALGLRGSGRRFRLVVFHGYMPAIPGPACNGLSEGLIEEAIQDRIDSDHTCSATSYRAAVGSYCVYPDDQRHYLQTDLSKAVQAIHGCPGDGRVASNPGGKLRATHWPTLGNRTGWPAFPGLCRHTAFPGRYPH
jgi:hypothetical protein